MGIKYDEVKKHYVVAYYRRHPKLGTRNVRRQGIKTKAEAERVYKELILLWGERFNRNMHPLWPEVVEQFLEYYANCGIQKNTLANYRQCLKLNTYERWGKKRINEFTTLEIRVFIQDELTHLSEAHRKNMLKYIRAVFRYAIEHELVQKDPTPKLKFKKNEKIKKMLNEGEIRIFLREARERNNPWYPIWAVACYTGLRNGELHALKWEHVDLEKRLIFIRESWNKINGLKDTKSGDDRIVEIAPSLVPIIEELKRNSQNEYVLPRLDYWDTGTQAKPLREFLLEIGLPEIRFHDLRASWATVMLSKGIEPIKIMMMGGWRDLKTMQIYIRKSGININGITDSLIF